MTRRFQMSSRYTRIGVVTYTSRPTVLVGLTTRKYSVNKILRRIRVLRGRRQTGRALHYAKKVFFTRRPECGRKRVLVLLTSGYSVDNVVLPSRGLRSNGVEIFAVMTNNRINKQLKTVLTTRQHGIVVSYRQAVSVVPRLAKTICHSPKG